MKNATNRPDGRQAPRTGMRKPYTKPRLVSHGHVSDVVKGAAGARGDGAAGHSRP